LVSALAIVLGVGTTFAAREVRADDDRLSKRYKTVLVLSSEDLTRPWLQQFIEGVRVAIQTADSAIAIYNEFIDGARFDTPADGDDLRAWLGRKYRDRNIDLILVQLERWHIDEARRPAGSRVEFRHAGLWRDYRGAVLGALVAGILQTLLIAVLLYERRRRRLAELEMRHHLIAAAHLNRRSAMGELAASIAHELNQPLGAILHNAEAATMALEGPAVSRELLREILDDIRKDDTRAAEIIRRLTALLRNGELEMQVLDVNALARETVDLVAAAAQSRGVHVDLQFDAGTPVVRGDRIHLQQVLLNLLLNSIDAMTVSAPAERPLIVRTSRDVDEIGIFVVDAGCGIPEGAVSRIFEPFYTTKGQGMGMGLCIARRIVEAHGGHVGARNNNERGATVWFTLPAMAG
jgi:signal transduction histidine kinase